MTEQEVEDILLEHRIPAIQLIQAKGVKTVCKLGGLPDVGEGFEWPVWKDEPLEFVAQLDLSALPALDQLKALPVTGMLYFFYDYRQRTRGFDPKEAGCWRVVYSADPGPPFEAQAPDGLPDDGVRVEKILAPRVIDSFPSLERLDVDPSLLPENVGEIERALRSLWFRNAPAHQVGGYPHPRQDDRMEFAAQLISNGLPGGSSKVYQHPRADAIKPGAADWLLLLQVDTEDATRMIVGDHERLYYWIRKQDLARHDFSKVWMFLQSDILGSLR